MKSFIIGIVLIVLLGTGIFFLLTKEDSMTPRADTVPTAQIPTPPTTASDAIPATEETTTPPTLVIQDQPFAEGVLIVELLETTEPIWLVAYDDDSGKPGRVIGKDAFAAGTHADVSITILEKTITGPVYVAIHKDAGEVGIFEFPGSDVALTMDGVVLIEMVNIL